MQNPTGKLAFAYASIGKLELKMLELKAENERLRAALEPFAKYADVFSGSFPYDGMVSTGSINGERLSITLAHLRNAREVLSACAI